MHHRPPGEEAGRDHFILLLILFELRTIDQLLPDPAASALDEVQRRAFELDAPAGEHRHARAEVRHVLDDVSGEDDHHILADLRQQVEEAVALLRVETGGRLVDDDEFGIADQRLGDAEALAPPEKPASAFLRTFHRLTCWRRVSTVCFRSAAEPIPFRTAM